MKRFLNTFCKAALLVLAFILSTPTAFAQAETSIAKSTGIGDGMLLFLMLFFVFLLLAIINALSGSIKSMSKPAADKVAAKNSDNAVAKSILVAGLLGASSNLSAANDTSILSNFQMTDGMFWVLLSVILFEVIIIFVLFRSLQSLIKLEKGESFEEELSKEDIFETLLMTDNVPIEEEESILMDHEYDGIRELDNNLPPWWKYMFYLTIIFAVVYSIRFQITGSGPSSHEEYMAEMAEAAAAKETMLAEATDLITEENVVQLIDAPSIEKGAAIYKGNCATCHGQLGEGGAGPNLTDEYWIHGGGMTNVFSTIKYGVPAKGMIAWESQFTPKQMQEVASYILTLKGTNPPNGKAPQGEIYKEEVITTPDTLATDTAMVELASE